MNLDKSLIFRSNSNFQIYFILVCFILAYPFGPLIVNTTIFIIIFFGSYLLFKNKFYHLLNDKILIFLLIFILYLVLNSLINFSGFSLYKSLSYLRFYFFAISLYLIFKYYYFFQKYFFLIIVGIGTLLSFDIIYQFIFNKDIFGFLPGMCQYQNSEIVNCERFAGYFNQELISGSYLAIYAIPAVFLVLNYIKKNNYIKFCFVIFFISLFTLAILISGERNPILILLIFYFFLLILNKSIRKYLILLFFIYAILIFFSLQNFKHLKHRYYNFPASKIKLINSADLNLIGKIATNQYGMHFINSYHVFSQNKFLGSGVRSFRDECKKYSTDYLSEVYQYKIVTGLNNGCSSHPHNIYFELASETGLIGLILFIIFLYFLIIKNLKDCLNNKNLAIAISVLISLVFPLKPTGAVFSTIYASFIFYYVGLILFYKNNVDKKI